MSCIRFCVCCRRDFCSRMVATWLMLAASSRWFIAVSLSRCSCIAILIHFQSLFSRHNTHWQADSATPTNQLALSHPGFPKGRICTSWRFLRWNVAVGDIPNDPRSVSNSSLREKVVVCLPNTPAPHPLAESWTHLTQEVSPVLAIEDDNRGVRHTASSATTGDRPNLADASSMPAKSAKGRYDFARKLWNEVRRFLRMLPVTVSLSYFPCHSCRSTSPPRP